MVLVEKDKGALSEVKWMATTKLLAVKDFIATALISTMRSVRNVQGRFLSGRLSRISCGTDLFPG